MVDQIEEKKVYYPETIDEQPLPETIPWETISNRPRTLDELDPATAAALENIENDFLTLGNLAYLDSITKTEITSQAITTPKLATGAVIASKIASGAITTTKLDAAAVTAAKIDVDDLFAQSITASGTITGARLRTASSGSRVEMSASANAFRIYDNSDLRLEIYDQFIYFNDDQGVGVAAIYASDSGNLLIAALQTNADILMSSGVSGQISFSVGTNEYMDMRSGEVNLYTWIDMNNFWIEDITGIYWDGVNSNPGRNGHMVYYDVGATEGLRMQFGGSDFQFDATGV